jgi:hypothetical protein
MRLRYLSTFLLTPILSVYAQNQPLLNPRLEAQVYSTTQYQGAQIDGMLPVGGDLTHNLHVDLQGLLNTGGQGWAGAGLGFRWLPNERNGLGAYVFADRNQLDPHHFFSIVSPGLEYFNARLDARLNTYFPVGKHRRVLNSGFGSELGLNTAHLIGRRLYDQYIDRTQEVGPGLDVSLGYHVAPRIPFIAQLGAYHFHFRDAHPINGVVLGGQFWLNPAWYLDAAYAYDNQQRSVATLSLGVRIGGTQHFYPAADRSVQSRITDPIDRYIAHSSYGAIPDRTVFLNATDRYLEQNPNHAGNSGDRGPDGTIVLQDHLFFFNQAVTSSTPITDPTQCTASNPCGPNQFTQAGVDGIALLDPLAVLYFNGGAYSTGFVPLALHPNQTLESRSNDFKQPASGGDRTTFFGELVLNGNTLNRISVQKFAFPTAVTIASGSNAINSSSLGDTNYAYTTGLDVQSGSVVASDSQIFANTTGVNVSGGSTFTGNTTLISATSNVNNTLGISASNGSTIKLTDSYIKAVSDGSSAIVAAIALNQANLIVTNSTINASSKLSSFGINAAGSLASISRSRVITNTQPATSSDNSTAINAEDSFFTIESSSLSAADNTPVGIALKNSGAIFIDSSANIQGKNLATGAIGDNANSTITFSGTNSFNLAGSKVQPFQLFPKPNISIGQGSTLTCLNSGNQIDCFA